MPLYSTPYHPHATPTFSIPTVYYLDVASISKRVRITSEPQTISLCHCVALMVYDHLLTLNMDRRVIWSSKRSIPTMIFLANRYILWPFCLAPVLWNLVQWNSAKVR